MFRLCIIYLTFKKNFFSVISSHYEICGGGVEQAGRVRGKDAQLAEENPI